MKIIFSKKFWQTFGVINGLMALPYLALAQTTGSGSGSFDAGLSNGKLRGLFPGSGLGGARTFGDLIYEIISIALFVAGAVAVVFVILGGYQYMTSAGNEEAAEKGKQNVINAIIGIVIIIMSYVIITVVANLVGTPNY